MLFLIKWYKKNKGDKMNIICIGHATYDITVLIDHFIKENMKVRLKNTTECGGGSACNTAYQLGKWGMNVSFIGLVGNDQYGNKIKNELDKVNVNTKYLKLDDNVNTSTSLVLANKQNGSRTILSYNITDKRISDINLDFKPDIILVDGWEYELSKNLIEKNKGSITVMDLDRYTENDIKLARMADFVICSKEFASRFIKEEITENNLENIYLKLKQYFDNIVITLEDKGCLYEYNGEIKVMPSIDVKALDSTAAGDIFHGAFVYALANEYDYEDAIMFSNIAAGLSVTKVGGRNSILSIEEVKAKYNEYR